MAPKEKNIFQDRGQATHRPSGENRVTIHAIVALLFDMGMP
jgi:hypothetical protein